MKKLYAIFRDTHIYIKKKKHKIFRTVKKNVKNVKCNVKYKMHLLRINLKKII